MNKEELAAKKSWFIEQVEEQIPDERRAETYYLALADAAGELKQSDQACECLYSSAEDILRIIADQEAAHKKLLEALVDKLKGQMIRGEHGG